MVMAAGMVAALAVLPVAAGIEQVRVSLGPEGGGLEFRWSAQDGDPDPEAELTWSVDGGPEQTTGAEVFGVASDPVTGASTVIYGANLPGIPPGAEITYGITGFGASRLGLNVRMPADETLRFVAYGDIGFDGLFRDGSTAPDSAPGSVQEQAIAAAPGLVIVPGDLAYDNTDLGWDRFARFQEPLTASVPIITVPGNHEYANDVDGYNQYDERYVSPDDDHFDTWTAGPVTFIGLNSHEACKDHLVERTQQTVTGPGPPCRSGFPNGEALDFLESALAAADADENPWTILVWHHQTYSHGNRGVGQVLLDLWMPIVEQYDVDLIVMGHDHLYSRSHPVVAGEPAQAVRAGVPGNATTRTPAVPWVYEKGQGPVHAVAGTGGRSLYGLSSEPSPPWLASLWQTHGLLRVDVTEEALDGVFLDVNGTVLDAFTIAEGADAEQDAPALGPVPVIAAISAMAYAWVRRRRDA